MIMAKASKTSWMEKGFHNPTAGKAGTTHKTLTHGEAFFATTQGKMPNVGGDHSKSKNVPR